MDNGSSRPVQGPTPCAGGCGFYGNPSFQNYCSKCYKEVASRATPSLKPAPSPASAPFAGQLDALPAAALSSPALPASIVPASVHVASPPIPANAATDDIEMSDSTKPAVTAATSAAVPASGASASVSAAVASPSAAGSAGAGASGAGGVAASAATPAASTEGGSNDNNAADDPNVQKNKSRCWICRKKVGLTGFECRCGYVFCGTHRYADQHACKFDYKTHDRSLLAKLNPKVQADKMEHI